MIRTEIANALHAEAFRLIESGAPDGAIVLLSALNFFTPGHAGVRDALARAHHELAKQRLATGRLEESITSFNHSLSVSGGKVETHAALAGALRLVGDVKSRARRPPRGKQLLLGSSEEPGSRDEGPALCPAAPPVTLDYQRSAALARAPLFPAHG
jgi:hypothetical protein